MTPSPSPNVRRLALLLGGLAMFGPFSIDTIFPGFPQIGADLGADPFRMQQTISVYLVAYALMSVVHGPLSDALGRRPVILGGLAVFAAASAGCALSTDFGELLAWRALQGLSAGVGIIVGRAVIRDLLHGDDAQRLMSQVSVIFGIAPAVAPVVGGWLLGWQRWPAIFWFLVAFSLALLLATWLALPETHPKPARLAPAPRALLRDYAGIFVNPRFQRLAAAGTFNFGALFLYIASAPAFVLQLLRIDGRHLRADEFAWFFVPMISGIARSRTSIAMRSPSTITDQPSCGRGSTPSKTRSGLRTVTGPAAASRSESEAIRRRMAATIAPMRHHAKRLTDC